MLLSIYDTDEAEDFFRSTVCLHVCVWEASNFLRLWVYLCGYLHYACYSKNYLSQPTAAMIELSVRCGGVLGFWGTLLSLVAAGSGAP
ncbi:hypothetical protein E2C01_067279 [Portunus trituberculatus]|uniref:Uncharacterized protein n=1 Tax=Portunus trituberculatus TaxID=210409 RepID=A0A5B7HS72_PORTR|nr:hypothetical protein [Portunus trituberculatus]